MRTYEFAVSGKERKNLVKILSEILDTPKKYLGTPSYAYTVGELTIDKNGTVTGELEAEVLEALVERGFVSQIGASDEDVAPETEVEANAEESTESEIQTEVEENAVPEAEEIIETETADRLTIEYPLDKFSPEKIDNLIKLVESKGTLIKQVLEIDELPIKVLNDRIAFPWFPVDVDNANAYAQFISALCDTAIKKRRVSAKPQTTHENPRFTMRIFLVGLGLIGREFDHCRKLMMRGLPGNSGFRYGKPDGETAPRQRDGKQREVISIRLSPDTLEKMSILASQAEAETGQRTSRNMLIEQVIEAYIATELGDAESTLESDALIAGEFEEASPAPQAAEESPANEASDDTPIEGEGANVGDINADTAEKEGEVAGDEQ